MAAVTDAPSPAPVVADLVDDVVANVAAVRARIERAGGDPDAITLVAVTKEQPRAVIGAALAAGVTDLGENRPAPLIEGSEQHPEARWHYLAPVQSNKVARLAAHVGLWQAVDRESVGRAIAARAPGAAVLVQVNLTDDAGRGGCRPEDAVALVNALRGEALDVRGLMAVAPLGPSSLAAAGFAKVRALADDLALPVRSFGMSNDLEEAVANGSTMVRIGAALFGPRPGADRARH